MSDKLDSSEGLKVRQTNTYAGQTRVSPFAAAAFRTFRTRRPMG